MSLHTFFSTLRALLSVEEKTIGPIKRQASRPTCDLFATPMIPPYSQTPPLFARARLIPIPLQPRQPRCFCARCAMQLLGFAMTAVSLRRPSKRAGIEPTRNGGAHCLLRQSSVFLSRSLTLLLLFSCLVIQILNLSLQDSIHLLVHILLSFSLQYEVYFGIHCFIFGTV